MIGLVLIYFLGKYFYDLAKKHNKSEWGFAILGVIVYYIGTFIGGLIISLAIVLINGDIDSTNSFFLGLLALPFGVLTAYLLYKLLEKKWGNSTIEQYEDILDGDLLGDDFLNDTKQ